MARADELVQTDAEQACLDALRGVTGQVDEPMERHCVRTFLIAERLAERAGAAVDREVLLCAAFVHDAGAYPSASTGDVYVSDGRRLAERALAPFGWPEERLRLCGNAIEQHHAWSSRESMGAEVELMRKADLVEVTRGLISFGIDRSWLKRLYREVPRNGFLRVLAWLLAHMIRERPGSLLRVPRPTA